MTVQVNYNETLSRSTLLKSMTIQMKTIKWPSAVVAIIFFVCKREYLGIVSCGV